MTISISRHGVRTRQQGNNIVSRIAAMVAVARQRRALRNLDDHLLHDIGVSNRAAAREAARPMWDVPAAWRK